MGVKPLIIGQALCRTCSRPFQGRSGGAYLNCLHGWGRLPNGVELADHFELDNLIPHYPGRSRNGKGDAFPRSEAILGVPRICQRIHDHGGPVVLAGRGVAGIMDHALRAADRIWFATTPYLELRSTEIKAEYLGDLHPPERRTFLVAVAPHPSGLNHWWNESRNRWKAMQFFAGLIRAYGGTVGPSPADPGEPSSQEESPEGKAPKA